MMHVGQILLHPATRIQLRLKGQTTAAATAAAMHRTKHRHDKALFTAKSLTALRSKVSLFVTSKAGPKGRNLEEPRGAYILQRVSSIVLDFLSLSLTLPVLPPSLFLLA
jgi:hypothetical protein